MNADASTVLDIVQACRRIGRFLADVDEAAFADAEEKHWAVYSQLCIIGEATKRLSPEFCKARPQLPWRQIAGTRDRLIHGYHEINWSIVWNTASKSVPELLQELEPLAVPDEDDTASSG